MLNGRLLAGTSFYHESDPLDKIAAVVDRSDAAQIQVGVGVDESRQENSIFKRDLLGFGRGLWLHLLRRTGGHHAALLVK